MTAPMKDALAAELAGLDPALKRQLERHAFDPDWLLDLAGMEGGPETPEGVEWCVRWNGQERIIFVLNHTTEPKQVPLDGGYVDLLTHRVLASATLELRPHQVVMLAAERMPTGATGTSNGGAGRIAQPAQ